MTAKNRTRSYSYCTLFDLNYLSRGLALVESLRQQGDSSQILVLCLDKETRVLLEPLADSLLLTLATLADLVAEYPELLEASNDRSLIELYFTCSPFLLKYDQRNKPEGHLSIYLDADLYFFDDPRNVVDEIGDHSVAIIEHNYPWFLKSLGKKYGKYNVGLVVFKKDTDGSETLDWWASECITWCHDYPDTGKYADQGYLGKFQLVSNNLTVLSNRGFNLAPWNTASSHLSVKAGKLSVNSNTLTFFHFHGLRKFSHFWISSQLNFLSPLPRREFKQIYSPYVYHLEEVEKRSISEVMTLKPLQRSVQGFRGVIPQIARALLALLSLGLGQVIVSRKKQNGN